VGRLSHEKNLPAYLELAVAGTKYVVGEGPLQAQLQRCYASDVAAGRMVFFGEQRGPALAALYAEADVFVLPSTTETFGNVILEALASGVPVAAYPVPGPQDILVGPHVGAMHSDLACAVQQALMHGRTADCLALARRYSWEAATAQFLKAVVPIGSK
jgi:glycosyltransferase involved in cell wall biosynthesis